MRRLLLAAVAVALLGAAATPSPGAIMISGKQLGASVVGEFKNFTAQVRLDPSAPGTGKVTVEVDTASIDLGLDDFNQELRSRTWFDSKNHPKASFSGSFKQTAPDRVTASGKLAIKGTTREVSFPASVKSEGTMRMFEGAVSIRRTDFNIGEGEWKATDTVADEVQIRFRIQVPAK
jgi:polyisoprenoid-binding protein YceI